MERLELVQTAFVFLGFVVSVITLLRLIRHFRIARTTTYIERINNPDFVKLRSKVDDWLHSSKSDAEKYLEVAESNQLKNDLHLFIHVFTELGIAYQFHAVNRKMVKTIFYPMIPSYWKELQFYIIASRLQNYQIGYYFEYLNRIMQDHYMAKAMREEVTKRYKPSKFYYSPQFEKERNSIELKYDIHQMERQESKPKPHST